MSRYSGPQGRGRRKVIKALKRTEAEARDAALPTDSPKRRKNRTPEARLLREIFGGGE